ncbi:hypothetical protein J4471_04330 [Candidatus Woesearchaeota archaeon]|nr:hypothetical protein [Candidatus Woesearchaeota archaeon]
MVLDNLSALPPGILALLIILAIWEFIWKAIAMWRAAKNNHKIWYVILLIFNTAGILPIIYIYFFSKKKIKKSK